MRFYLYSLIFLLLVGFAFGQPTAPNHTADYVTLVWDAGPASLQTNGAFIRKDVWDAEPDKSKFVRTQGDAAATAWNGSKTGAAITEGAGDTILVTAAGIGQGIIDYTGTNVEYQDSGTADGNYYVLRVSDNSVTLVGLAYSDLSGDQGCDIRIGGAIDGVASLIANAAGIADAGGFNCDVLMRGPETLASTAALSAGGGSATTVLGFIGVNSSWVEDGTRVVITTTSLLANGLFSYDNIDYTELRNIDLDGGVGKAEYCIYNNVDTANANKVVNCLLHDADNHGAVLGGSGSLQSGWFFIDTKVFNNGLGGSGGGLIGRSTARGPMTIIGCSIHDNAGIGIQIGVTSHIAFTEVYDNTGIGISAQLYSDVSFLFNNTVFNNGGAGFWFHRDAETLIVYNNASVGNTGVGYDFDTTNTTIYFGFNLSAANSAHYSLAADGTFAAFADGNNQASSQTADQIFEIITNGFEDLTPESGSDLIDNGIDSHTIGAKESVTTGGNVVIIRRQ